MADFKKQILEDIEEYSSKYPYIKNISKPEWAFNFWILDKLFSIEESLIDEYIIDYNDKGIDCYVWHEDSMDLYLIQNKFYDNETPITVDYVFNDFLTRAIGALEKGTYTRSKELQGIYSKYRQEEDFNVHFHLYISNNKCKANKVLIEKLKEYNEENIKEKRDVQMFSLDDIQENYYKGPIKRKQTFKYKISTINKGTILKVDNAAYKMTLAADARYVLTPVMVVYQMMEESKQKEYSLFSDNIREYLGGNVSINKKIAETLKDSNDRNNFFFYNNGITMIVDRIGNDNPEGKKRMFEVFNPQIVNGCQTVNTIYETLKSLPPSKLEKDFENTFVMIKILQIPAKDEEKKALYGNIVKYNNSQNSIDEKTFVASSEIFSRLQSEFEGKGFLIKIKQSDKYTYCNIKYQKPTLLFEKSNIFLERYKISMSKTSDFIIDLEKLLQVFLSFSGKTTDAIQGKSKILKIDSPQNKIVLEFLKNPEITNNDKLNLLMLYLRAEEEKKKSDDGKTPNPFYLINWFSKYECKGDVRNISKHLDTEEKIDSIVKKYILVFKLYYRKWSKKYEEKGNDYNTMIKSPIDISLLDEVYEDALDMLQAYM